MATKARVAPAKAQTFSFSAEFLRVAELWRKTPGRKSSPDYAFIHAEPHRNGGAYILATDGSAMFVGHDKRAKIKEAVNIALPPDLDRNDLKGTTTLSRTVSGDRDHCVISDGDFELKFNHAWILPGMWPNWRRLMPEAESFDHAQVYMPRVMNADYLRKIGAMYETMAEERAVYFMVKAVDHNVLIFFPWQTDFFILLSPMQGEFPRIQFPSWLPADDAEGL